MKKNILILVGILLAVTLLISVTTKSSQNRALKVGVITPLSGSSAYWGESTRVGVTMAELELKKQNIDISFITEDGQLDPKIALNAAQKLVNVDKVQAIYSEFNPASISVSSFLKDKDVFHLYNSAAVSPLDSGPYNLKTYLDYEEGCRKTAEYIKSHKNISRVGVLKINIEFGDLCVKGIKEVYAHSDVVVESYDPGTTDFRTALTMLSRQNIDVIFNPSFQGETIASLQQMHDLKINKMFIGLEETITPDIALKYSPTLQGDIFFGLPHVQKGLMEKIKNTNDGKDVANYNAAALAYVHLVQLGTALHNCGSDNACIAKQMNQNTPNSEVGFEGFTNRKAKFNTLISEWGSSGFVEVQ